MTCFFVRVIDHLVEVPPPIGLVNIAFCIRRTYFSAVVGSVTKLY
jgi:hypothetical protein